MRKVITYGTFDLFHRGHYNILKRAKEEGDYLIVGVTGENYDMERGKLAVQDSLATRVENVQKTGFADQIIVEEYLGQKISDILKYDVDVLVIGSDWKGKFDHLRKYCEVKYLERTKDISSTQLREERLDIYKFGVALDGPDDNHAISEAKRVSGIHVESVYCEDADCAGSFADSHELNSAFTDYDAFLQQIDIVYIKVAQEKRRALVERAIRAGKHVVCDVPYTLDPGQEAGLRALAEEKGVVLLDNITTLHLQAFGPLLWMARGNLIGDLRSAKFAVSRKHMGDKALTCFSDLAYYPLCVLLKIMGNDIRENSFKLVKNEDNEVSYALLTFSYENAVATIEISMDSEVNDGIRLLGSTGTIHVPGDWWNIGYFTMKNNGEENYKRYSFNYEGNGFRYLVRAMLSYIKSSRVGNQGILPSEAETILSLLKKMDAGL